MMWLQPWPRGIASYEKTTIGDSVVASAINALRIFLGLPVNVVRLPIRVDGARSVIALIHQRSGSYSVSFPDFPGCISSGRTQREAIWRGATALSSRIQGMIAGGEPIPRVRGLFKLRKDPVFRAAASDAITVTLPVHYRRARRDRTQATQE